MVNISGQNKCIKKEEAIDFLSFSNVDRALRLVVIQLENSIYAAGSTSLFSL
jgi:hypothetical protein